MEITIVVTLTESNTFRAVCTSPVSVEADAGSREEAIRQVKDRVRESLARGQVITTMIEIKQHPLKRFAGAWKDDELFAQWERGLEEYRANREVTLEPHE